MKKFLSIIPLQVQLDSYCYKAVGNRRLAANEETAFPIMTAIRGYTQPDEPIAVIAVVTDTEVGHQNAKRFREEVEAFCSAPEHHRPLFYFEVSVDTDEQVSSQTAVFQELIKLVDDDDELFACITYGTKPRAMALLMAVKYAYRVKKNAAISCIVYGQIDRPEKDPATWQGYVYDMTALVQMDEIVRVLAEQGVADPEGAIGQILSL